MSYKRRDKMFDACLEALTEKPKRRMSDAVIVEMVWRNMQCIKPHCPLLVFGRQLADEINRYMFEEE